MVVSAAQKFRTRLLKMVAKEPIKELLQQGLDQTLYLLDKWEKMT
jgi:hypothetical protein